MGCRPAQVPMLRRAWVLFPVSMALGFAALTAALYALVPLWEWLVPRGPLADWLRGQGHPTVAGYWGLAWLQVPCWVVSGAGGAVLGALCGKRWASTGAWFAVGFLVPVLVVNIIHANALSHLEFKHRAMAFFWDLSCVGIVFAAAAVARHFAQQREARGANPRVQTAAATRTDGRDEG